MDFSGAFSWMNIRFLLEGLKVTVEVSLFSIIFSFLIVLRISLSFPKSLV